MKIIYPTWNGQTPSEWVWALHCDFLPNSMEGRGKVDKFTKLQRNLTNGTSTK